MDWEKPNAIRDKVAETEEFTMKEFATKYAEQLIIYNTQYLDLKDARDRLFQTVGYLESEKYAPGKTYHLIEPSA